MTQMDCPLSKIQSQFAKGMVIGVAVMEQGICPDMSILPDLKGIGYFFSGILMIIAFLFGYLAFPFLLVDVVMRVSLVAATSPLLIAASLFKSTAKMTQRGIWSLVQCSLTLVFGTAVGGIGKAVIAYILANLPSTGSQQSTTGGTQQFNSWQTLTQALENPCSAGLSIGFTSGSYYMLIGTAIILIFMMRRASHLASEITGIASDGVGAQAGVAFLVGQAASIAGSATQILYQSATKQRPGGSDDKARAVTGNAPK